MEFVMTQASQPREFAKPPRATQSFSSALADFDHLPNSAHVRVAIVAAIRGCSVPTVWRHASQGILPKPKKLGGVTAWNVGELRAAMGQ
jgi:predicted DNA-binding transcriptional regulator AlpA